MRNVSPALAEFLVGHPTNAFVAAGHTFTLTDGTILRVTDLPVNLSVLQPGGSTLVWYKGILLVKRPQFKLGLGANPDKQTLSIGFFAPSSETPSLVEGISFIAALQEGLFNGAAYSFDEFYWASPADFAAGSQPIGNNTALPNGTYTDGRINMFAGYLGAVKSLSRIQCQIDINDIRIRLDTDFPRNTYYAQCQHTLYDSGCTLSRSAFTQSYTATAGSTNSLLYTSSEAANTYALGAITFTSGNNNLRTRQVQFDTGGAMGWVQPLGFAVAAGDTFTVSWGCDHALTTCTNKFNNKSHYRGFISVPPPQITI